MKHARIYAKNYLFYDFTFSIIRFNSIMQNDNFPDKFYKRMASGQHIILCLVSDFPKLIKLLVLNFYEVIFDVVHPISLQYSAKHM